MNTTPPTTTEPANSILTQYLAHHDAPCPRCRYNLRNLTTNQCPECGLELALQVKGTQPILKWWLTTLLANTLPLGFHAFVSIGIMIDQSSGFSRWENWMLIPLTITPLTIIIIAALVWKRRVFVLRSPIFQRLVANISLILHPFAITLLFLLI